MKKHIWMGGVLAGLMMACSPASQDQAEGSIDVLPAFENLTELKVSHLGKNIRYVPLETTDSSLIGSGCKASLLGDKIMVTYGMRGESHCYLFDSKTGKFVREVGHKGEDPRGYSEPKAYVHPVTGNLYFHRAPNKLIKYTQEGEFLGEVEMPNGLTSGLYPLLTKDGMLVYEGETFNVQHQSQLYYLDETKGKTAEVALSDVVKSEEIDPSGIQNISVFGAGADVYGLLGHAGTIKVGFKDETQGLFMFISHRPYGRIVEHEQSLCLVLESYLYRTSMSQQAIGIGSGSKDTDALNPRGVYFLTFHDIGQSHFGGLPFGFVQIIQLALMLNVESFPFVHQHAVLGEQRIESARKSVGHLHFAQKLPFLRVLDQLVRSTMEIEVSRHRMDIRLRFAISSWIFSFMTNLTNELSRLTIEQIAMAFSTHAIGHHNLVAQQTRRTSTTNKR